jgi:hypothetical protein
LMVQEGNTTEKRIAKKKNNNLSRMFFSIKIRM